jgi:hypothetical protein
MPDYSRRKGETGQARAARIRREINQENDALNLLPDDWVRGRRVCKFSDLKLNRRSPWILARATPDEIALQEKKLEALRKQKEQLETRQAWRSQPHVAAANAICWAIETDIEAVIDRLAPQEWLDLKDRIISR